MVRKTRSAVLLAKVESTYGQDPTPTPTEDDDALLIQDPEVDVDPTLLERENVKKSISSVPHVVGQKLVNVSFTTELKTHGTADAGDSTDPIPIDPLLRGCALSPTYTAESSSGAGDGEVVYSPVSDSFESVTFYIYMDGVLHKVHGAYGTCTVNAPSGEFATVDWEFTGLYETPTDDTASTPSFTDQKPEQVQNMGLSIGGYEGIIAALEVDMGIEIGNREDVNSPEGLKGFTITNRNVTGSVDPEATTEAENDFWTQFENGTENTVTGSWGSAGNVVQIDGPSVQYQDLNYGDREGILTYDAPLTFAEDTANDEITFTFK